VTRFCKCTCHHIVNAFEVFTRSEFGNHAPVYPVDILREDYMPKKLVLIPQHRSARLIAARLQAEDEC